MYRLALAAVTIIMCPYALGAETQPRHLDKTDTSVEGVCRDYPERVRQLFAALDLDRAGLEKVKAAVGREDWPAACRTLLDYYRSGKTAEWLRDPKPKPSKAIMAEADDALADWISIMSDRRKLPRAADGRANWHPTDHIGWNTGLHRQAYLRRLHAAYHGTGNEKYARGYDRFIRDWVTANPYPGKWAPPSREGTKKAMAWWGLEPGIRLKIWSTTFFGLQQADGFTPAGRILMLSSIPDHADFLMKSRMPYGGNWIVSQMRGLATAGGCWPEFADAGKWLDHASTEMARSMKGQVYPDGVQVELSTGYHRTVTSNFQDFTNLIRRMGRDVTPEFRAMHEKMYSYLAYSARPTGYGVLNNDTRPSRSGRFLRRRAPEFNRPDWLYIITNGKEGAKPTVGPSIVFPWAGQVIMRSGWDAEAHWAFFDMGPFGAGHQHNDKLHLSITAHGRDLLVDAGIHSYQSPTKMYFRASVAHNVLLIDNNGRYPGPRVWKEPMRGNYAVLPEVDFAHGALERGFAAMDRKGEHRRAVLYVRGAYWVVVDRLSLPRPASVQALWHFHPDCTVEATGQAVASVDPDKGNLRIVPAAAFPWTVTMVKGRKDPMQGWYSPKYNFLVPSPCAVYTGQIGKTATFAWVMVPAGGLVPEVAVQRLPAPESAIRLRVTRPGSGPDEIAIRMEGEGPVPLSNGLALTGACALLRAGKPPLVVGGRILDASGKLRAEHTLGPATQTQPAGGR